MPDENNKIVKPHKLTFSKDGKFGLGAKIAEKQEILKTIDVSTLPNRLGLVFDDSGSMASDRAIDKAHEAVDAFCKTCNPADTAIAFYPMNAGSQKLSNDMMQIAFYCNTVGATGGTPFWGTLKKVLEENITRAVVFSDGSPTDDFGYDFNRPNGSRIDNEAEVTKLYVDKKIPVDTIFIGRAGGGTIMQKLSEATGGIFMHFTDASVLAKGLKYLAPRFRAMLANPEVKAAIERGELNI